MRGHGAHIEDVIPMAGQSPDLLVVRDLIRNATAQQIAKVKEVLSGHSPTQHAGIALIGLRGAGKSTLGRMLAKSIGWTFVELNKEIERLSDLSVAEIIALYGQEGFRRKEQEALADLLPNESLWFWLPVAVRFRASDVRSCVVVLLHGVAARFSRRTHGTRPETR